MNSLSYSSVTGKPTLGTLAALNQLTKLNATTYIEAGAIGSALIDQAYINELFGANATFSGTLSAAKGSFSGTLNAATGSFSGSLSAASGTFAGTVYAEKISGDLVDGDVFSVPAVNVWDNQTEAVTSFNVERNAKYDTYLKLSFADAVMENNNDAFLYISSGGTVQGRSLTIIPQGTGNTVITVRIDGGVAQDNGALSKLKAGQIAAQLFRKGAGFIT